MPHDAGAEVPSHETQENPREAWEERYTASDRVWSGRPNDSLVALASDWEPGDALELGCGEGGDAIWLAGLGWQVDAVDVAPTALARARRAAEAQGRSERITWIEHDLATWQPQGTYDQVTASFLHSPIDFPRSQVLRRAASALRVGGRLLIIGHAAPPPWMPPEHAQHHEFLSAEEERDRLALDPQHWQVEECRLRSRTADGPEGPADMVDSILLMRRSD
jgi:SAM-dependent methyltransferase